MYNLLHFRVTPLITYAEPNDTIYWDLEKGYPQHHLTIRNGTNVLPYWVEFAGEDFGLIVELIQNISEWQLPCSKAHTGFQVSKLSCVLDNTQFF